MKTNQLFSKSCLQGPPIYQGILLIGIVEQLIKFLIVQNVNINLVPLIYSLIRGITKKGKH